MRVENQVSRCLESIVRQFHLFSWNLVHPQLPGNINTVIAVYDHLLSIINDVLERFFNPAIPLDQLGELGNRLFRDTVSSPQLARCDHVHTFGRFLGPMRIFGYLA